MVYQVGIIGTGAFAHTHAQALAALGERVAVVGAANTHVDVGRTFCAHYGIPHSFASAETLLDALHPDLVIICTPPATHAALAQTALAAGAHVLCEKPLCGSLAVFDTLAQTEALSGRTLSTVFQWRFGAAAQHYQRLIRDGAFGALRAAVCHTLWYRDADYFAVPWRGRWDDSLGGTLMGHGIHLIDLMLWLVPDWRDVSARIATFDQPIEVENLGGALVSFEGGALASVLSSAVSPRQETYLRLDFQDATLEVRALYHYDSHQWALTTRDPADAARWTPPPAGTNSLDAQIGALLDSLERGERPLVTGAEARRVLEFMTATYKAAHTGERVRRESIAPGDPFYASMRGV